MVGRKEAQKRRKKGRGEGGIQTGQECPGYWGGGSEGECRGYSGSQNSFPFSGLFLDRGSWASTTAG
jgi:hypothetical protein